MEKFFFFVLVCFGLVFFVVFFSRTQVAWMPERKRTVCVFVVLIKCSPLEIGLRDVHWGNYVFVVRTCWKVKCQEELVRSWEIAARILKALLFGFFFFLLRVWAGTQRMVKILSAHKTTLWILTRRRKFWFNYFSVCLTALAFLF